MPFLPSTSESETIVGIQFGIFSPDEIIRRSVVEITNHNTQEGKIGGLFDPRMGVLENGKNCRSCFQNNHKCQGHWGYYRLARPVYYIQFFKLVLKVLRCCCLKCGKLLIEKNKHLNLLKLKGEARWKQALIACQKISRCGEETEDGCGARQPRNYTEEDICKIYAEWKDMEIPVDQELPEGAKETGTIGDAKEGKVTARLVTLRKFLEPEYVHRLLKRITDEDVDFMGFSRYWCRPDWMMCSVLAIPPPQVRPSVLQDNNQRSEDDLTQKLVDIIKTNTLLADKISKNIKKKVIDEWTNVLQYHIATFINNEIPGIAPSAQRSGRPLKSVQQRLGSKEGRIRNNLQGKRVEHSARTVITPDPNLSIKEIGVPIKIASNLTYPERVTVFNIDKLYKLIQNGPDVYPGAKTIVRSSDNRMISLKHISGKDLQLFEGDIVNRHLMDGDYVLFNRQPSLHRMSMMGHQVRVLPYNTFRLNVSVTAPYNADFDGDEMNLHAPQSEEAAMELREIAAVPLQIVSPRDSKPIVSVVQDTLVGVNRFMRSNVKLTMSEVMNMLAFAPNWSGVLPPPAEAERGQKWLGRQVVSVLLPPLNLEMPNGQYDEEKDKGNYETPNFVRIRNGEIQQGVFDKTIFSSALIHLIYNDYGADTTVRFLDSLQRIVANYLINSGFSVGLSDLIADENTRKEIDKLMGELKSKIENIIQQVHLGLFDNASGRSNQDEFERLIFGELNQVVNTAGKLGRNSLADNNRMTNMIKAGSKGSNTNVAQMIAVLGQQNVEGKRIPYGLQDRTLPHFKRYDDGAASRGFIESSFIKGLTPAETFFHAMSGREGLIDTAVKTADTGYLQRQLVKAMEDLMTHHDKTVRDAAGTIIQFSYGEDGTNSTKIEYQPLPLSDLSDEQINEQFAVVDAGADGETFVAQIKADRKMLVEGVMGGKPVGNNVAGPVHLPRTVKNIVLQLNLSKEEPNKVTGGQVLAMIQSILDRTMPSNKIWGALLRFHLNPQTIQRKGFTQAALEVLATQIINRNWFSWCLPGEMVGIIAAQSIGEPSTQMSAHKSTLIHVVSTTNGEHYVGPIGPFIDRYFKTTDTDSVVLDLTENNGFKIIGVSNDEKTSWKSISQISRHPANGGLVQVITKSGRKTTATLSHSFLKRGYILPGMKTGVVPVLGSDLKVGMRIPIARSIPPVETKNEVTIGTNTVSLDKEFGWLCGMYLADGSLNGNTVQIAKIHPLVEVLLQKISTKYGWDFSTKYHDGEYGTSKDNNIYCKELKMFLLENFGTGSYNKTLNGSVFSYSREFQQGLLGGYFDGDGNVNVENQLIRVGSRSEDLIRSINRLFSYCGFFTFLGQETSTNKIMYTLGVMKKDATKFKQEIGFALAEKAVALDQIIEYNNRSDIHDTKDVYDKIANLGLIIAETGKLLRMPGQSRNYGRWTKKESIGRRTLATYIEDFKEQLENLQNQFDTETIARITLNLNELESAVNADVVWDEIVELVYLDDPKEYVYDFTVPGNDSFMVDDCIMVHNTLNTFHLAGVASKSAVTRGIPRLKELLKATRNPKASSLTIFLRQELRKSKEAARRVAQELEFTLLVDLVRVARIYFDPRDETTVVTQDQEWLSFFRAYETVSAEVTEGQGQGQEQEQTDASKAKQSPWILRLELDRDKMFLKNITMEDVLYVVNRRFSNIVTSYTDYNADELVVRIRLELENDPMDDLLALKKLQNNLLSNSLVRGITGLKSVTFSVMKDCFEFTGTKYERVEQFVLDTDGTNFLDVVCHPDVDPHRLYSNNIHDIYANLGVEATRAVLLREISSLFEDNNVNYRHFGLLCDVICSKGKLMTVDRYGINKNNIGPLAKASFEQTEDIMLRAALFGELDPITGVSANIMTGQPIRGGTSFSSILLDEEALKKFMGEMTEGINEVEKEDEFTEEDEERTLYEARTASGKDDHCSLPRLRLEASIPTQKEVATEYSDMEITLV